MTHNALATFLLLSTVLDCKKSGSIGSIVSTAQAVEELRIASGDFTSPDEELANAIAKVAIGIGCSVLFDEQPGANASQLFG